MITINSTNFIHYTAETCYFVNCESDTYVIVIENPEDELVGMMLVIAIDAANCSNN